MNRSIIVGPLLLMLFAGCTNTTNDTIGVPLIDEEPNSDPIGHENDAVEAPLPPPRLANGTIFKYAAENWTYEWKVQGQYATSNNTDYELQGYWSNGSRLWLEYWRLDVDTLNINRHSSGDITFANTCPAGEGGILPLQNRTYACPVEFMYQHKMNPIFEIEIHGRSQISVEGASYSTTNFTLSATRDGERYVFMHGAYSDDIGFFTWFDFSWHDQPSMTLVGIETP